MRAAVTRTPLFTAAFAIHCRAALATRIESFPVPAYRSSVPRLLFEGEPLAAARCCGAMLVDVGDSHEADYSRAGNVRGKAVLPSIARRLFASRLTAIPRPKNMIEFPPMAALATYSNRNCAGLGCP